MTEQESDALTQLRSENAELKQMATKLSEAATHSHIREMTWVYALEGNRDGVWDWNAVTNEVFFSKRWKEMLGFEEDEITNQLSEWERRVHPEDRADVYEKLNAHLNGDTRHYESEHRLLCKDGTYKWILDRGKIVSWTEDGKPFRVVGTHTDVTIRKEAELENARLVAELRDALERVKRLQGLLPICAHCKKIRDDQGYWNQIENYISEHSEADFTHGICPECAEKYYKEYLDEGSC